MQGAEGIVRVIISNDYPGAIYACTTYGSGRRLKLVYKFFDGDGYEITTETGDVHF